MARSRRRPTRIDRSRISFRTNWSMTSRNRHDSNHEHRHDGCGAVHAQRMQRTFDNHRNGGFCRSPSRRILRDQSNIDARELQARPARRVSPGSLWQRTIAGAICCRQLRFAIQRGPDQRWGDLHLYADEGCRECANGRSSGKLRSWQHPERAPPFIEVDRSCQCRTIQEHDTTTAKYAPRRIALVRAHVTPLMASSRGQHRAFAGSVQRGRRSRQARNKTNGRVIACPA